MAVKRDLYSPELLTPQDLAFVRQLTASNAGNQTSRDIEAWIDFLRLPVHARELLAQVGVQKGDPLLIAFQNFEEDFHAHLEGRAVKLLDALRRRDTSFLADDYEYAGFLFFLFLQLFRTVKWNETISAEISPTPGVRLESAWRVLRYVFASNAASTVFVERQNWRLRFLESCPTTSFITGDQPLFNTVPLPRAKAEAPEELVLYYPVAPTLALLLVEETRVANGAVTSLTTDETKRYNQLTVANSYLQAYGVSRKVLCELRRE
ncbi:MAG TPA: DUF4238 domain-containing protein [Blastocatellia bacterium]|nr:DUF4238 domain-containing protein [Blastocatellia bacterium]